MSKPLRFQHFKGGTYQLICVANDATAGRPMKTMVVYRSEQDDRIWARNQEEFHELVTCTDGSNVPRFRLIKEE